MEGCWSSFAVDMNLAGRDISMRKVCLCTLLTCPQISAKKAQKTKIVADMQERERERDRESTNKDFVSGCEDLFVPSHD